MTYVYGTLVALYGLFFGSFFNVVGLRVPKGESIVTPPSHCVACKRQLKWFELVPVLSWLALRGRCKTCGEKISVVYPVVESGTALLFVAVFVQWGWTVECYIGWFAISVFACLTAADFAYYKIPNKILFPGIAILAVARAFAHPLGLSTYLFGAIAGYVLLYLIALFSRGGMGYGDVKLFLFVGLFVGFSGMILTLVLASFIGTVYGVVLRLLKKLGRRERIAFGPFIALACVLTELYGETLIHAYFAIL